MSGKKEKTTEQLSAPAGEGAPSSTASREARVSEQLLRKVLRQHKLTDTARSFSTMWPVAWIILHRLAHLIRTTPEAAEHAEHLLGTCVIDGFDAVIETYARDGSAEVLFPTEKERLMAFYEALLTPARGHVPLDQLLSERDPWLSPTDPTPDRATNPFRALTDGRSE